jgi:carotenoid cleavage dioxygenase-like enzyme
MTTSVSQAPQIADYRLGFQSLDEETAVERLPVSGELPTWLSGALVRVTPAKLEVGERRVAHWFDGLAMLNRFGFAGGRVSYRSRFIEGEAYGAARAGEWSGRGFATDPCRSIFKRVQSLFSPEVSDNVNVNLAQLGERYIAMTETPMPVEFDPETLETVGGVRYADALGGQVTTAHPHHDRQRDELVNYVVSFGRHTEYRLYGLPAGTRERRPIASHRIKEPAYMHAFGMSERFLILAEYPLRVNPLRLGFSGKPFIENYRWRPEQGTTFLVFDRASGELRGSYETEAFFCFHHVNAFERGSELVLDLLAYEDPQIISSLYLDETGPVGPTGADLATELRRYKIDLERGSVSAEALTEGTLELPRMDYARRNTRDYSYAYFAGAGGDWFDRLVKVDVRDGARSEWSAPGCHPGEPIFVREPGTSEEDAGVVLSVVLDASAGRSFLLVLDAGSFEELARAEAPHHIPYGFHGQYLRGAA